MRPIHTVLVTVVLMVLVAGCLGSPTANGSPAYRALTFDEPGSPSPVVEGGLTYPRGADGGAGRFYATVIGSDEDATRFNRSLLTPNATRFVDETEFESSFLVVIQAFPASTVPDYRVESVRREGGTLRIRINDSSAFGTDDVTLETVLIRVAGTPPQQVVITTEDGFEFEADGGVVTRTPRDG